MEDSVSSVTFDDQVIQVEDRTNPFLLFFRVQSSELNVIQIMKGLMRSDEPRLRDVHCEGIDGFNWEVLKGRFGDGEAAERKSG